MLLIVSIYSLFSIDGYLNLYDKKVIILLQILSSKENAYDFPDQFIGTKNKTQTNRYYQHPQTS